MVHIDSRQTSHAFVSASEQELQIFPVDLQRTAVSAVRGGYIFLFLCFHILQKLMVNEIKEQPFIITIRISQVFEEWPSRC